MKLIVEFETCLAVTMTDKQRHEHCNNCTGALPGEMNLVLRARKVENEVCPEKDEVFVLM